MTAPSWVDAPIRMSGNGRYFCDAQGQPFFWLCDSVWSFFAQYPLDDAERYLRKRAEQGFNVVMGVLVWSGGSGLEKPAPFANDRGDLPWLENNPAMPNPVYFERVEHLLKVAAAHGLILNLLPTWGYFVNDAHTLTPENAKAYGLWLGARFRDTPNLVWTNGGDRIPLGYEDVYRALAYGLREGDGGAHLIGYHPGGLSSSGRFFHSEDWLDFNIIQTWGAWERIYPAVSADVLRTPNKPVVMGEGGYEAGDYPQGVMTPLALRRQAWWTFLAGGFYTYGHSAMWLPEPGWIDALDAPGAAQMGIFKQIVASRRWWEMVPSQVMFSEGVGVGKTLNAAARTQDGTCAMIYLSSQCHALVNIYEMNAKRVKAAWVHPPTGEQREVGVLVRQPEWWKYDTHWFATPDHWEDAVLVLDRVE